MHSGVYAIGYCIIPLEQTVQSAMPTFVTIVGRPNITYHAVRSEDLRPLIGDPPLPNTAKPYILYEFDNQLPIGVAAQEDLNDREPHLHIYDHNGSITGHHMNYKFKAWSVKDDHWNYHYIVTNTGTDDGTSA